jgi:hypothetical protein
MEHAVSAWWFIQANIDEILAYVVASGVITVVIQYLKKKLDVDSKRKILAAVGALSFVPEAINELANHPEWANALPDNCAWLFSGAIVLHAFLVSPLTKKLATSLRPYLQAVAEIKERDSAQTSFPNPNAAISQPSESVSQSTVQPQPKQRPEERPLVI